MLSDVVLLPDSFTVTLTFWLWHDAKEPLSVAMVDSNGDEEIVWNGTPDEAKTWTEISVDATAWKSQPVQLKFAFSTAGDGGMGVYVDDIQFLSDCSYPECGNALCDGVENCFTCPDDCATPETCPENDGCSDWEYPGCVGCACEAEVCESNPECCDVMWDSTCVTACGATDVQDCGPKPGCVSSGGTPGCGGCECEECVCASDSFCCNSSWDSICANACKACGQDCGPVVCDPGTSRTATEAALSNPGSPMASAIRP